MPSIPLVDLKAQYLRYKEEFDAALARCLESSQFIGGLECEAFRREFAEFCGVEHAALCGNGTDALYLALLETLGKGDGGGEVITVSHTFIATAEAISHAGYRPVFIDIDPDTYLMDVHLIEGAITPRTVAILPVHLYGQMVPMDAVMDIAQQHDLRVIEDAAQAHGATWQGKGPGCWGDVACFSFYPGKNLGAWGDGGAIVTRGPKLAQRFEMRANHGRRDKYLHDFEGVNSRLDAIHAAVLRVKLKYLAEWNRARQQAAAYYDDLLRRIEGVRTPVIRDGAEHVFHLYVVQVPERDRVLAGLNRRGIGAGVHYPVPLHEQPAYAAMEMPPESLPVTHQIAKTILSLPIYPEITLEEIEAVVSALSQELAR